MNATAQLQADDTRSTDAIKYDEDLPRRDEPFVDPRHLYTEADLAWIDSLLAHAVAGTRAAVGRGGTYDDEIEYDEDAAAREVAASSPPELDPEREATEQQHQHQEYIAALKAGGVYHLYQQAQARRERSGASSKRSARPLKTPGTLPAADLGIDPAECATGPSVFELRACIRTVGDPDVVLVRNREALRAGGVQFGDSVDHAVWTYILGRYPAGSVEAPTLRELQDRHWAADPGEQAQYRRRLESLRDYALCTVEVRGGATICAPYVPPTRTLPAGGIGGFGLAALAKVVEARLNDPRVVEDLGLCERGQLGPDGGTILSPFRPETRGSFSITVGERGTLRGRDFGTDDYVGLLDLIAVANGWKRPADDEKVIVEGARLAGIDAAKFLEGLGEQHEAVLPAIPQVTPEAVGLEAVQTEAVGLEAVQSEPVQSEPVQAEPVQAEAADLDADAAAEVPQAATAPPPPQQLAEPSVVLPATVLDAVWARHTAPITSDSRACAWLKLRHLDPGAIEAKGLARALTPAAPHPGRDIKFPADYDLSRPGSYFDGWAAFRHKAGHRVVIRTLTIKRWASFRTRSTRSGAEVKELPVDQLGAAGQFVANKPIEDWILNGGPCPQKWIIDEGSTDYLTDATHDADDPSVGVVGIWRGSWTQELADEIPNGTEIVIKVDSDDTGKEYQLDIARTLRGRCKLKALHRVWVQGTNDKLIKQPDVNERLGAAVAAGRPYSRLDGVGDWHFDWQSAPPARGKGDKGAPRSVPLQLVELVAAQGADLFRSTGDSIFAKVEGCSFELYSKDFEMAVRRWYRKECGETISDTALRQALATLSAEAYERPKREVFVRVGHTTDGKVYLDLGQHGNARAVEVVPGKGWRIVDKPGCEFVRPPTQQPLPEPVHGGDFGRLWDYVNVTPSRRPLVAGYLLTSICPRLGTYFALVLSGSGGVGKTTACNTIRGVFDPDEVGLESPPDDPKKLNLQAENTWICGFDNLDRAQPWFSDALCRISTGGGSRERELYYNKRCVVFKARRPILLNGIEEVPARGDLLSRSLLVSLDPIRKKKGAKRLPRLFAAAHPGILGALLDALAGALPVLDVEPPDEFEAETRDPDLDLLIVAGEERLGFPRGAFRDAYRRQAKVSSAIPLDSSPVTKPLLRFLADCEQEERGPDEPLWRGSASLLHDLVSQHATDEERRKPGWPSLAHFLSGALRKLAANLDTVHRIAVSFDDAEREAKARPPITFRRSAPANPA